MKKLVLITLVAACTQTDSTDILTSGIYADLGARSSGDGTTTVSATLFLGNPINLNFVDVTGDDELIASNAGEDKVMIQTELLNVVSHHAVFQTDLEGEEFEIAFLRDVDAGAPLSIATLPADFTIDPVAQASRAAPMTVTWAPSGSDDLMSWSADGDCIEHTSGTIADDSGSVAIPQNTFTKKQGATVADSCAITLTITRARLGLLDTHYGKGGTISGSQARNVTFTSAP